MTLLAAVNNTAAAQELEEIVVTAQRRTENLQTVPLSITAFSGDELLDQNILNLSDLQYSVPSFIYDEFSAGQPRYYMRGVGNNLQSGALDDNVGVFVDGVYLARPEMTNNDFLDIERVEVLRGPQGTLSGRNVVGGSIQFHTRRPSDEVIISGLISAGNYNAIDASGYISGPLSENLFGKIAATTRNHDGYNFNTTTQNDVEDEQFAGLRTALRYTPSDTIDIQLSLDSSRRRGTESWSYPIAPSPTLQGPLHPDNLRRGEHNTDDGKANVDNWGTNLNVDWEIGLGTLTSITAYRYSELDVAMTVSDGIRAAELTDPPELKERLAQTRYIQAYYAETEQFSQEIRLASPADNVLDWIVGAYLAKVDTFYNSEDRYRFVFADLEGHVGFISDTATESMALFGNANYDITDSLSVQGGLRWTRDEKTIEHSTSGLPVFGVWTVDGVVVDGFTTDVNKDWDAVTPQVSLKYQATPGMFVYGTIARGFKSGGFSKGQVEKRAAETPAEPEYALNHEIGVKTEWLDRTLRLNLAAFYMTYDDMQIRTSVPLNEFQNIEIVASAGEAEIKGVELELDWSINDNLLVHTIYSFLDTEISDTIINNIDQSGNELPKAPTHKVNIGGFYSIDLNENFGLRLRADYSYISEFYGFPQNDPITLVPSRDNVNAGIAIVGRNDNWSVEVWGKNLTDEVHPSTITLVQGTGYALPFDPPRVYGITVRVRN